MLFDFVIEKSDKNNFKFQFIISLIQKFIFKMDFINHSIEATLEIIEKLQLFYSK